MAFHWRADNGPKFNAGLEALWFSGDPDQSYILVISGPPVPALRKSRNKYERKRGAKTIFGLNWFAFFGQENKGIHFREKENRPRYRIIRVLKTCE